VRVFLLYFVRVDILIRGSFLNDTARITDPKYEPTNCALFCAAVPPLRLITHLIADIIRARVRTMGMEEHRFVLESGTYC